MRDAHITMSEPLRIDGQPGYETRIDATSGKDNTPVTVVQWLRFGGSDHLAHHRQRAARRLAESLPPLPRRSRRHPAARIAKACRLLMSQNAEEVLLSHEVERSSSDRRKPFSKDEATLSTVAQAALGSLPLAALALAPPLATPTSAGRSTRSPIM